MGKLTVVATGKDNVERTVHIQENVVLGTLVVLAVAVCALFPLMSEHMIVPWLESAFIYVPDTLAVALSDSNMLILLVMLLALILIFVPFFGRGTKRRIVPNYLSGEGLSNNTYNGSMGTTIEVGLRNWYMTDWFGEDRIRRIGEILTALTIVVIIILVAGGVSL